jgi:hypothetical protein
MGQALLIYPCLSPTSNTSVGWILLHILQIIFNKYKYNQIYNISFI